MAALEEYDPFKSVLKSHMLRAASEDVDVGLYGDLKHEIIAKLYDEIDGGCAEWIAEQLAKPIHLVHAVVISMHNENLIFIYFEKRKTCVDARWRLTSETWTKEAARREAAQSRSDS